MRNFDERKAEIFRRSENRIKERKRNRNRILALCVPLCLCIAILSVIYLPDMMISSDKSNTAEDMNMAGGFNGTSGFIYTSLDITDYNGLSDYTKKETDKVNIENIYNIIQSAFADEDDKETIEMQDKLPETQKGEGATKGDANGENHSSSHPSGTSYFLTFYTEDGKQIIYVLYENNLTNNATNESVILSKEQLSKLLKIIES